MNKPMQKYKATFESQKFTRMEGFWAESEVQARKIAKDLAKKYGARLVEVILDKRQKESA